jgi:APA family basic amino acid/polyamine antiporter
VTAVDLPRKLSFFDGAALLVGSVIGSGIFVVPSLIAQRVPEPGLVIGIWIFSGLLVLCGALTLAELGAMLPHSGGLYVYMREAYGPFWAFLYGWTIMLVVIPGAMAALTRLRAWSRSWGWRSPPGAGIRRISSRSRQTSSRAAC